VAQEQLLQGGRPADQAAHAHAGELPQRRVQRLGVDVEADPAVLPAQIVHAGQVGQPLRPADQLGLDGGTGQVAQVGERAGLHGPTVTDDGEPVAQRLDLGQDVAGQQHGAAAAALLLPDDLTEHLLHQRVQARGRLVQQQQLHIRGRRGDQRHLLPVTLGVRAPLLAGVQVEALQQLGAAPRVQPAAQPAEQVDHLATGQARPQRDVPGDVGQPPVQRGRVGPRVAAEQPRGTGIRPHQAQQHPDRGGLPGAVGAEEAVHLTGTHGQVQPVQGAGAPERLDQTVSANRVGHVVLLLHARGIMRAAAG
jgi:hypothetical protein